MTFKKIFKQVEDVPGWMGKCDCRVLYDYARTVEGLIVEIGSFAGISTKVLELSSPKSEIIAIDPLEKIYQDMYDPDFIYKVFMSLVDNNRTTLIRDYSQNVAITWNREIDLLHIDGDHRYRGVKKDIVHFVPWVKKGGYVLFHDYVVGKEEKETDLWFYDNEEYGIHKAIKECMDMFESVETVSGFAVCKKK